MHPIEYEIKDALDTAMSVSHHDLHFGNDSEGRLRTKHYGKRAYFNFPIAKFPYTSSTCI